MKLCSHKREKANVKRRFCSNNGQQICGIAEKPFYCYQWQIPRGGGGARDTRLTQGSNFLRFHAVFKGNPGSATDLQ